MYETILVEKKNRVAIITLNRPEMRNALNSQLIAEMLAVLQELEGDSEIGAVIIRGAGSMFCQSGAE